MLKNVIWITWEKQIRNKSMAYNLDIELYEVIINANRLMRYPKSIIGTLRIIQSRSPKIVIAPNPSIVLGYFLLLIKKYFNFLLITDAHYGGVKAWNKIPFFQRFLDYYNVRTDLIVVTNNGHADFLRSKGGKVFICQDPLPSLPNAKEIKNINFEKSVFFICSFDCDEPFKEVFEAFNILKSKGFSFFVTGNYQKSNFDTNDYPNVNFLGFVPDAEFYGYLKQCSIVLDLTNWEDCLVCGAYEALKAGKIIVLSNTTALRNYFSPAAVLTDHTSKAIAENINFAYENRELIYQEIDNWVIQNTKYMKKNIENLKNLILSMK